MQEMSNYKVKRLFKMKEEAIKYFIILLIIFSGALHIESIFHHAGIDIIPKETKQIFYLIKFIIWVALMIGTCLSLVYNLYRKYWFEYNK